jgi:hypothetical protein
MAMDLKQIVGNSLFDSPRCDLCGPSSNNLNPFLYEFGFRKEIAF